jgi:hypothetical protein
MNTHCRTLNLFLPIFAEGCRYSELLVNRLTRLKFAIDPVSGRMYDQNALLLYAPDFSGNA